MSVKYEIIGVKFNSPISEEAIQTFVHHNDKLVFNKKTMIVTEQFTTIFQKQKYQNLDLRKCLYQDYNFGDDIFQYQCQFILSAKSPQMNIRKHEQRGGGNRGRPRNDEVRVRAERKKPCRDCQTHCIHRTSQSVQSHVAEPQMVVIQQV